MVEIVEWQREMFPHSHLASYIEHLREEVAELRADPTDGEETADVFIILVRIAALQGVDLRAEVERKFSINKARLWGRVQPNGTVKHLPQ